LGARCLLSVLRHGCALRLGDTDAQPLQQGAQQRLDTASTALRAQLALGAQRR
jgi:hypothetical protein